MVRFLSLILQVATSSEDSSARQCGQFSAIRHCFEWSL